MSRRNRLIVVTEEPQLAVAVAEVSRGDESIESCDVCRDLEDLMVTVDRDEALVVLVDIDAEPQRILADLDPVTSRFSDTWFVVVAREQQSDWMLQAMQAGARHFLVKDAIASDLAGVLRRVAPRGTSRNGAYGSILTVLSAGGGVGATTLALNLANELSLFSDDRFIGSQSPCLFVDLDCAFGGSAGMLGLSAQYGLADVLADGDRVDAHLIRSTAVPYSDQLHVLASPATVSPHDPMTPDFRHLSRALQGAKESYLYSVVDAPRLPMNATATLARASVMTYIVFELNVEDIRIARHLHGSLVERGIAPERIRPLANRCRGRRSAISLSDAQKAIGVGRIDHLSNDFNSAVAAINYGKLLAEQTPRSTLRKEIQDLATVVRRTAVAPKAAQAVES